MQGEIAEQFIIPTKDEFLVCTKDEVAEQDVEGFVFSKLQELHPGKLIYLSIFLSIHL